MRHNIESLFASGNFTLDGNRKQNLRIRPYKDYRAAYLSKFPQGSLKNFRAVLTDVLVKNHHDILSNKEGDYTCYRPSLHFGLYVSI
jgi:hypothetical protein